MDASFICGVKGRPDALGVKSVSVSIMAVETLLPAADSFADMDAPMEMERDKRVDWPELATFVESVFARRFEDVAELDLAPDIIGLFEPFLD
ncbi:hypothetical protein HDU80_011429 [Chytriomyces hyalinus]|nr:hypothetical protein HDU80_011429 [Chytriomyces hyalinus]